jgi:pyridoxal 5''-phosphate synthase, glutaminase subunit Pdx2
VGGNPPLIGILALQGDVAEHREMLQRLGADTCDIRSTADLQGLKGLVVPGGESTVMDKLVRRFGLDKPLKDLISSGIPVLGTCAGLIMCAERLTDGIEGQQTLGGLDVTVSRNAFGSQRESFDSELTVSGLESPVAVSFIRAPIVTQWAMG